MVGGIVQSALVSITNVAWSYAFGHLAYRTLNSVHPVRKVAAMVGVVIHIAGAILINLAVAHYRDLLATDPKNALAETLPRVFENPFALQTIDSILLFAIGSVIAMLAVWKAYRSDDRYPHYGRMDRLHKGARARFREARDRLVSETESALFGGLEAVDKAIRHLKKEVNEARNVHSSFQTIEGRLKTSEQAVSDAARQLLKMYRQANEYIRDAPAPAFFKTYDRLGHSFEHMPKSSPYDKKMEGLTTIIEQAEGEANQAKQRIQDMVDELRKKLDVFLENIQEGALKDIERDRNDLERMDRT